MRSKLAWWRVLIASKSWWWNSGNLLLTTSFGPFSGIGPNFGISFIRCFVGLSQNQRLRVCGIVRSPLLLAVRGLVTHLSLHLGIFRFLLFAEDLIDS